MSYYGFDYFCGANTLVQINGIYSLEVAGLSMSINEGKMPIYGYSSRHFDAVAWGRVIVQGSLLINYVDQDYFWRVIEMGYGTTLPPVPEPALGNPAQQDEVAKQIVSSYAENFQLAEALKREHWGPSSSTGQSFTGNPHDLKNQINIKVTFGDEDETSNNYSHTGYVINSVYFTGRGQTIQVSEDVIVEQIPFIARDIHSLDRYR
jgi:hypothetical protein